MEFLDPSHEGYASGFVAAPRLSSLHGKKVALLSNGKQGTRSFFAALKTRLQVQHGASSVVVLTKANYSAPAEDAVLQQAVSADVVIAGVGD